MPIRPEEIDPTVALAFNDRLTQIFAPQASLDPVAGRIRSAGTKKWKETVRKHALRFWISGASLITAFSVPPLVGQESGLVAALGFIGFIGLAVVQVVSAFVETQKELAENLHPDLLRAASHLIAPTRAEQLYCEAVAQLIEAEPYLGEVTMREILSQLNVLLENHRKLDTPLKQIRGAMGSTSVESLDRELRDLELRRSEQSDPAALEIMDQSITMCADRLKGARALEPGLEKVEAQQDLILQTFASVQANLARATVAPGPSSLPQVQALQQSVLQVNQQTRAVEEAIQEVVSIKG